MKYYLNTILQKNGYKESDSFDITEYFEDSYSGPKQKDRP